MPEQAEAEVIELSREERLERELKIMESYPHERGVTRGTVLQYDGWQWALVTELALERDPIRVGFVLLDELGDAVTSELEQALGCWEHYGVVEAYRDTEHEYWTDIDYVLTDDVWDVLGPLHPEERS